MGLFEDVLDGYRGKQETSIKTTQNAQLSALGGEYLNPLWVARHPISEVTYPESLLSGWVVTGTTGAQSAGTAHTHGIPLSTTNASSGILSVAQIQESIGAYVSMSKHMVVDTVGMWVRKALSSPALNNVYFEIFKENADTSLSRVWVSSDISGSITTGVTWLEVTVSPGLLVAAGERYMVRMRNNSSNNVAVGPACVLSTAISPVATFYTGTTGGGSLTNQTSYTAAEATTAKATTNLYAYVMLANTGGAAKDVLWKDDGNRVNVGGDWYQKTTTGAFVISDNRFAFGGATNGSQNGLFIRPTSGDTVVVEADLWDTTATKAGLIGWANRDFSQMLYLAVTDAAVSLHAGSSTSLTQQWTEAVEANNAHWAVAYDPGSNDFTVTKDGVVVGTPWVDSGNDIDHGADFRYGGMRFERASSVNGGTVDNWVMRDGTL